MQAAILTRPGRLEGGGRFVRFERVFRFANWFSGNQVDNSMSLEFLNYIATIRGRAD